VCAYREPQPLPIPRAVADEPANSAALSIHPLLSLVRHATKANNVNNALFVGLQCVSSQHAYGAFTVAASMEVILFWCVVCPPGLLSNPKAGIRGTLEEADHRVHISVQKIEFCTQVGFHRWHSSIGASDFHDGQSYAT
jgi:hypothetical protein